MLEIRNSRNVTKFAFGRGSLSMLPRLIDERRQASPGPVIFLVDEFFRGSDWVRALPARDGDWIELIPTRDEPTVEQADALAERARELARGGGIAAVVGMGGGITLDLVKSTANLLANPGKAEDYQGWDLVKNPAAYKIGIPTISGTGAEASRTCVLMNTRKNLKLGMNSEHTVYDQLILDPELTRTVPRDQYFYTGMDTHIHCVESLEGRYRNGIGDAFSREALRLCEDVFLSSDMMTDENREKLMVASYLGGCAIGNSYVGVVHPFSAGLSMVLGTHHCLANCIVMNRMDEFYPEASRQFREMAARQGVKIPTGVCQGLSEEQYERLYLSTVVHEKPLTNALGPGYRDILTREKVREIFQSL